MSKSKYMNDNKIRYSDSEPIGDKILYVPWHLVINQTITKSERIVGELCQLIELMGLSEKQESGLKKKLKQAVYNAGNDSLDWLCESLHYHNIKTDKFGTTDRWGEPFGAEGPQEVNGMATSKSGKLPPTVGQE